MSNRGGPSVVPALAFNVLEADYDGGGGVGVGGGVGGGGLLPDAPAQLPQLPQLPVQLIPESVAPTAVAVPQVRGIERTKIIL